MKRYLVGGAVRDALLGLPVKERDWVVVGATPEDMVAAGYLPVGKDFPVFLHPQSKEEHALARTERKTARGYHGFSFYTGPEVKLEDDLVRRDLTINAIAQDDDGTIIDPHHGRDDLQKKILRHVSAAFAEDPVRILRLARFAARFAPLGFTIAPETIALMKQMVAAGEADALVAERVWQETQRALMGEQPSTFFKVLRECGALARVMPELDALFGVPQPEKHHPEVDSGVHVLMVVDCAAQRQAPLAVRYACLCHDFGKALSPAHQLPAHHGHEHSGLPLVEKFSERLRVPSACRELALAVTRDHLNVHQAQQLRPATLLTLLERLDAFRKPARFEEFLLACECDARGRLGLAQRDYPQPQYLRDALAAANAVQVKDVMADGFAGAQIGEELHRRRAQALAQWKAGRA
ncbi:MAG TPA: multifunctional CCA addition/repair protein [Nevskiaceae bacterium]|nr:multifunctional CCA addition/repair protein [Nevskiaceae bacterium]